MPGPQSRDAPRFTGKRILQFLLEYEFCATTAGLNATQTVWQITRYCDLKSEQFIELLDEYHGDDWQAFKTWFMEFYPSEEEKPYYKVSHPIKLVQKSWKLSSIEKFNNYFRDFTVISKSLEDREALSQTDKFDYFWRGIKPVSFHDEIGSALRHSRQWTDLTNPPPMSRAVKFIKLCLKRDLYRVIEEDVQNGSSDNETASDSEDSDDESDSMDSESDKGPRWMKHKKHQLKAEVKQKKEEPVPKATEAKVQDSGEPLKSNIDDLVEKIRRLTIALGQIDGDKVAKWPGKFTPMSMKCFMCAEEGHALKDCPETKAFIAKKILKLSNEGRLVQVDGSDLPWGDINNGGVACILCDQLANASNLEMENLLSWDVMNQEFATFGDSTYKVFPAERKQEELEPKWTEPYTKEQKGKGPEHPNRVYVQLPKRTMKEHKPSASKEQVPTILKQEVQVQEPILDMLNKDVEMRDGTPKDRAGRKQKGMKDGKSPLDLKIKDRTPKSTLDDVVIQDTKDQIKKRALPAYQFASELQEKVNVEALFKARMEKEVLLMLGDVFGLSFELCKRLQIVTKTQCIPVTQDAAASKSLEVMINLVEQGVEPLQAGKRPWKPPLINCLPKKGDPEKKMYLQTPGWTDEDNDVHNDDLGSACCGSRCPCVNWAPKNELIINSVSCDSDDESSNDAILDYSESNTDDQAEKFYKWQLENEHNRVFNVKETDFSFHLSFLAMVTVRIQGSIMDSSCTMLIDNGSELNIMVQSIQSKLELPMDPSGKDWLLWGVSGHQVSLVGLCCNALVEVGGVPQSHC
jgi:Protein of unknown function (DUF4100)